MLYLHKVLPMLFLPVGLTLLLVGLGLVLRKRIFGWLGMVLLYGLSTGLVSSWILGLLEGDGVRQKVEEVQPAAAVVVLSGMLRNRADTSRGEWSEAVDRFEGGVDLVRAGKAPLLIFTGGHVPWNPRARPEGEILKERAVQLGIPGDKILVTPKVGNTEAEARAVREVLQEWQRLHPPADSRILLVTSAFHMRRASLLFARQGLQVNVFPVDFQVPDRQKTTILSFLPKAEYLEDSEIAMREGVGMLYYTFIKR